MRSSGIGKPVARIVSVAFVVALMVNGVASAQEAAPVFQPGEKLRFGLRWGFIPAGEAVLEVLPIENFKGQEVYHFVMTVRTNAFIDTFYRYRSRIDAYADVDMTRSIFYNSRTEAGRSIKETQVHFDWEKNEAYYYRIKTELGRQPETRERKRRTMLMPGSFDPLSVFYYTRFLRFDQNCPLERPVTDGKKCVVASAAVLKREEVSINGKAYDTFVIQPDLKHVEGVFEKSENARITIWLTADDRRIPVKLKSKIIVGSFTGELLAAEGVENMQFSEQARLDPRFQGFSLSDTTETD
jgi:hypothetical protein